ncbi:MAG: hypothetical protein NUV59_02625 [Patescibacteria group bacterium]|nr:hypothetical protein [Patescibacteria group bacterium]
MTKGDAESEEHRRKVRRMFVKGFEPSYSAFTSIRHYHGDIARDLMLGGAALSLISSPLYADSLSAQFPFIIAGVFAAVAAAGLTNPKRQWSVVADAVVSGAALVIYAGWGLLGYEEAGPVAFVMRLAIAVIFMFAFYFSMKTVRAFALREVGADEQDGEIGVRGIHTQDESK